MDIFWLFFNYDLIVCPDKRDQIIALDLYSDREDPPSRLNDKNMSTSECEHILFGLIDKYQKDK